MKIKVSAVAFSKNAFLTSKLKDNFKTAVVNSEGKRFTVDELVDYFSDAEGVIVGLEKIDSNLLDRLPGLKIIAKYGVGLDNIDLEACRTRGVKVGWTAGVNKESVAEMALGFMLMLCRNLYLTSNQLKKGTWNKSGGWSLRGKTIGIIGMGHIGKHLSQLLLPFGCRVIGNDIHDVELSGFNGRVTLTDKVTLFKEADIISIHTPLTTETTHMVNKAAIDLMKPTAFIINTARGGIIDEDALKSALIEKRIAGAAIDVYQTEPPTDADLLTQENLVCTPHIAGNSYEAVVAMGDAAISHLIEYSKNPK
jgi:phosphoglycerate dehydrogenase-like enzyme